MSLDPSRWRSASEYAYAEELSAPDLAWEWLRRNAQYQHDYASGKQKNKDPQDLTRIVRQSWGLRFPDRSAARCVAGCCLLAARDRPRNCHFDLLYAVGKYSRDNIPEPRPTGHPNRPGRYEPHTKNRHGNSAFVAA